MYVKKLYKRDLIMSEKANDRFLDALQRREEHRKNKRDEDITYKEKWLRHMDFLQSVSPQNNAVTFLYDTTVNGFIYVNDPQKILGTYDPVDFTCETGQDFLFSNIHPDQRSAALLILLKTISYTIEHPAANVKDLIANITFSYKRKNGTYIQLLQKSIVVETDDSGYPLLFLRYGYDISHLVKPSAGLIINNPHETLVWDYSITKKCLEQVNLLSTQEKKILYFLAEGKPSKEIADEVFLSPHTIDTHRRNLLKKMNCIDTTALITFAKMTGLI